jgi:hypothetical protein
MRLGELAFGCYVFSRGYDSAYDQLLAETAPALDLDNDRHRMALLRWLNKWGCRQFAKGSHSVASTELKAWYKEFEHDLFSETEGLLSLTDEHLDKVEQAYSGLLVRTASYRGKAKSRITVGPAGTAKILFALRPNALMPWDDPIRAKFGWDGSARSYRDHLLMARGWLNELSSECNAQGFQLSDLPSKIGRPKSSLAKLIDEYLWVTITAQCAAPDKITLQRWADWS